MSTPAQSQESLLDEIVRIATDNQQSLTVLLRKCLVLSFQLKNDELKSWLRQELDGYQSADGLPDYRTANIGALGNFSDGYNSRTRVPIPSLMMEKEHRDRAEIVPLMEAVSAYEHLNSQTGGVVSYRWPANFIAYYQRKFFGNRFTLLEAWQEVPKNVIVQLLNAVRNRVLNMALELHSEFGSRDLTKITPTEVIKANQTVNNFVFHGLAIITSGPQAQVTLNANNIIARDWKQLGAVLKSYGLTDQDLKELSEAEEADGDQKMGEKTTGWIKKAGLKVVGIGADVAKDVLTASLKQYLGL